MDYAAGAYSVEVGVDASFVACNGNMAALFAVVSFGLVQVSRDLEKVTGFAYVSCALMAAVYLGFALRPSVGVLMVLGVGYGIGNGMFLAVDYALACDVLPSAQTTAQ